MASKSEPRRNHGSISGIDEEYYPEFYGVEEFNKIAKVLKLPVVSKDILRQVLETRGSNLSAYSKRLLTTNDKREEITANAIFKDLLRRSVRAELRKREPSSAIPKPSEVKFNLKIIEQLDRARADYLIDKETNFGIARPAEIKKQLQALLKGAKSFILVLEGLDEITLDLLAKTGSISPHKLYPISTDLVIDLHKISEATKLALEGLKKDKGGRPPQLALRQYITKLADIYKEATNTKVDPCVTYSPYSDDGESYTGPFYTLVKTCLALTDEEAFYTDAALAEQIKRVRRLRSEKHQT